MARQAGGVKVFDKNFNPLFNNNTIFKNNIISSFCKDKEGNVILGTFGEGLIVITNLELTEINLPNPNLKITQVTSSNNNSIYLGTQNGKIYKIDSTQQISLFRDEEVKIIEVLEYFEETNELLINNHIPTFINLATKKEKTKALGAIKDVVHVAPNKYLIANNIGVFYLNFSSKSIGKNTLSLKYLPSFTGRTNCVDFDPQTNTIYAGTSLGLKIGNETSAKYFTIDDKTIMCRDILYFEGKVYISTKNNNKLPFIFCRF